jgi:hypothetical protein
MLQLAQHALGFSSIDFFSLDVEGGEALVLQTFDWRVPVKLWLVELDGNDPRRNDVVREMLAAHGYVPYIAPEVFNGARHDFYFSRAGGANEAFIHRDLWLSTPERVSSCKKCSLKY